MNASAEIQWPYTVSWIDCLSGAATRGIYMCGAHAPANTVPPPYKPRELRVPFTPPLMLNAMTLKLFNDFYFRRRLPQGVFTQHYRPFFYPLDSIGNWNLIYGRKGFFQYQCVLPPENSRDGITQLLRRIEQSGQGSFLAVLKTFGAKIPAGMLSFARPGTTLALDFPNRGEATLRLFRDLDAILREADGALYPAKDARMPADLFRAAYPAWEKFAAFIDPKFSSSFWRRVAA
jgi:hypothetical protein